ncbi:hypothetical protein ONE63_007511 [Megalurothrips usitatus]|uniref:Cytokine-inducible SH2-containing protein n=1 Tax=Megalurothrips usitatus TaxID=439358 RepID=A0AAV7XMZ0_9NEOP|nr:hypothetical protein ONE63_007511 [Megalurothrips usitatus]
MSAMTVCPKCRHEFPPHSPPPPPAPQPSPRTPTPPPPPAPACPCSGPGLGGAAPAAWLPLAPAPVQPAPPASLSLSITASSATSLNGGHVLVNTTPAPSAPSISVTATLPAVPQMWPWAQVQMPSWTMMPTPGPAPAPQQQPLTLPLSMPAWAAPRPAVAWGAPPPTPLTLGLELYHAAPRPPPTPTPKGAQYRLTGGGLLQDRGQEAPVLLQPRGKPSPPGAVPEQSPSTPLSFVLPGGEAASRSPSPTSAAAVPDGTPEADLRLLQATTQALKSSGWYYEGFSWQESAATLRNAALGTFLVRDSSDPRFLFSLSVQTDRGPTSVRLLYIAGGFRLDAEPHLAPTMPLFPCVLQLVEHYVAHRGKRGSSAPSSAPPSRTREQVWVDARGQMYSHILLSAPRRHTVPGLQHLARLAVHRQLKSVTIQERCQRISELELPTTLCRYLEEYPYTI